MPELDLILPSGRGRRSPAKAAQTTRDGVLDALEQRIDSLGEELSWEQGERICRAVEAYTTLGLDLVHLLRFSLGVVAWKMKTEARQGDAVAQECAERWGVNVSTLRLYMRAVRHCEGDIRRFNAFLQSDKGRYKPQTEITEWCKLIEDRDLLPEDAAQELRMIQVERGAEMIEKALAQETDPERRETIVQIQASASGIEIGYVVENGEFSNGESSNGEAQADGDDEEIPVVEAQTLLPAIYLAARYSKASLMREVRDRLERYGYRITSRWIDGNHQISAEEMKDEALVMEKGRRFASEDWADMMEADIVVSFTEVPRETNTRGGRHVEFGGALAMGKRLLVVGHRENVFHCLEEVEFFADRFDMMNQLIDEIEVVAV